MRHSGANIHGINVPGTTAKYKGVAAGLGGDPLLSVRFVLSPVLGDFSPFCFSTNSTSSLKFTDLRLHRPVDTEVEPRRCGSTESNL